MGRKGSPKHVHMPSELFDFLTQSEKQAYWAYHNQLAKLNMSMKLLYQLARQRKKRKDEEKHGRCIDWRNQP